MKRTELKRKTPLKAHTGLMASRIKLCRSCGSPFTPRGSMDRACGPRCEQRLADQRAQRSKAAPVRSRSDLEETLQEAVNAYVRVRDAGLACISCGCQMGGFGRELQAGHYRSIGACPELRYDLRNINGQCRHCNETLSGNRIEYRKGLVLRIGEQAVAEIEGPHPALKLQEDDLRRMIREVRAMKRDLIKARGG